jgi:hypothetical protein
MISRPRRYRSYLVRLWASESDQAAWRASAEDTLTGERKHFSGLAQLFQFLEQQTRESQTCEPTPSASE